MLAYTPDDPRSKSRIVPQHQDVKVFLLLFLQKKKNLLF